MSARKGVSQSEPWLQESTRLYWLGLLLVLILPLVSAPLGLLSSGSPVDFSESWRFYLQPLLGLFVGGVVVGFAVYLFVGRVIVAVLGIIFAMLSFSFVINAFVFSGNYGDMSNFVFEWGIKLSEKRVLLNYLSLLIVISLIFWIVFTKKTRILVNAMQVALLATLSLALMDSYLFFNKRAGIETQSIPDQAEVFNFSKTGKNVVVIMMDRMVGSFVPTALDLVSGLEPGLEGFVWYPKTLSPGAFTILGVPPIAGGYDYLPAQINNLDDSVTLSDRLDQSLRVLPYNFDRAGFDTSIVQPSSFFKAKNKKHLKNTKLTWLTNSYHNHWRKRNGIVNVSSSVHSILAHFGLFRVSPLSVRPLIYSDGSWSPFQKSGKHEDVKARLEKNETWVRSTYYGGINSQKNITAIKHWSVLDDLPLLSKVQESSKGQFYFFTNELTHEPWITRPDLELELDGPITFSEKAIKKFKGRYSAQHAYTAAAALKHLLEWVEWMKQNDVYDNTRIILVSDHGRNIHAPMFTKQRLTKNGKLGAESGQVGYFHSTLMVKNFNSRDDFLTSNKFMTIADVPWLALENLYAGVNPYTGNKVQEPQNKTPWSVAYSPWRMSEQGMYKFSLYEHFLVESEDIFDVGNWREMPAGSQLPKPTLQYRGSD